MDISESQMLSWSSWGRNEGVWCWGVGKTVGSLNAQLFDILLWTRHSSSSSKQTDGLGDLQTICQYNLLSFANVPWLITLCTCLPYWTVHHLHSNVVRQSSSYENLNMEQEHGNSYINVPKENKSWCQVILVYNIFSKNVWWPPITQIFLCYEFMHIH